MTEKPKLKWFQHRNRLDRESTVEFVPGRKVTVIDGFCCARKKNEKFAIRQLGYKEVHVFKVPKPTRDKLKDVLKA